MTDFGSGGDLGQLSSLISGLRSQIAGLKSDIHGLTGSTSGSSNMLAGALGGFNGGTGMGQIVSGALTAGLGIAAGASMMMPNVGQTMSQASNYYRTALFSGGMNRGRLEQQVLRASGGYQSSPGAMAMAANYLGGIGMGANTSEFMPTMTATSNISRLLNIDNLSAAQAVSGLSSGSMSSRLFTSMGIMTSDPNTGKGKTTEQIFASMANVLYGGRGKMTSADLEKSFRSGLTGVSLDSVGFDDTQKQMFLTYMLNRGKGVKTNFSSSSMMGDLTKAGLTSGNADPLASTMKLYGTQSSQMTAAESSYITGTDNGVAAFQGLDGVVRGLIGTFGELNARVQTFMGTNVGQGITTGVQSVFNGVSQIFSGLAGGAAGAGAMLKGAPVPVDGVRNAIGSATISDSGMGVGGGMSVPPASGPITAKFGQKGAMWGAAGHNGTDYGVPDGSAVHAVADGTVSSSAVGSGPYSYGKYITLDHGDGYQTRYAHLSQPNVYPGDKVRAGQVIGQSGHSGHVTGPHLHFEVVKNGTSVNPANFLANSSKKSPGKSSANVSAPGQSLFQVTMAGVSAAAQSISELFGGSSTPATVSALSASSKTGIGGPSGGIGMGYMSSIGSGGGGGNNVSINVNIASASEAEARKFALIVKEYLEKDSLTSNMGRF